MSGLDEFDPATDLPKDFFLIMYGMRRTGKTTCLMTMLESMKDRFKNHKVFVFTGTGKDNPAQWKNFPLNVINSDIANINTSVGKVIGEQRENIKKEVIRQLMEKSVNQVDGAEKKEGKVDEEERKKEEDKQKLDKKGKTRGKKRKRGKAEKKDESDNVSGVPEKEDKGFDNDLERFPGVLDRRFTDLKNITDADIMAARRDGLIDDNMLPHILIILDDVVNEGSIRNSQNLNALAVHGRHLMITAIVLSQCVCGSMSVPPGIRINSDYVMVMGNPRSVRERQLLQEQYLTISNDKDHSSDGLRILSDVSREEFRCLVIKVASSSATRFQDYLFKYGPVPEPPDNVSEDFKMGTDEQWKKDEKINRKPQFSDKDFTKEPPNTTPLQTIDSGRFAPGGAFGVAGDNHVSKGISKFTSFGGGEFLASIF
jgi:hypothetical protein